MTNAATVIERAYAAFNNRDIDGVLALMAEDVSWPKASEGGKVVGKEEIRAYWKRQWSEFNPSVTPEVVTEEGEGKVRVTVHQIVKSLHDELLSDSSVVHVFTMRDGLIAGMELGDDGNAKTGPSIAFAHSS